MSQKRKLIPGDDTGPSNSKRYCPTTLDSDEEPKPKPSQPRVDPTYGQRGAFPGLDCSADNDALFYGPAADGLEYLRMVRSEAKTVPNLLVAEKSPANQPADLDSDDHQGFYADGAYIAAPFQVTNGRAEHLGSRELEEDAQEAYYASLCARFTAFSSLLQDSPPSDLISSSALQSAQRLALGSNHHWRSLLNTVPSTAILGQLSQESVVHGLRMLESRLTKEQILKKETLGLWAWGLLARCREAGQMGSEEISVLRDLGKSAVWLLRALRAGVEHGLQDTEEQNHDADIPVQDENEEGVLDEKGSQDGEAHHEPYHYPQKVNSHQKVTAEEKSEEEHPVAALTPKDSAASRDDPTDAFAETRARILSSLPLASTTGEPNDPVIEFDTAEAGQSYAEPLAAAGANARDDAALPKQRQALTRFCATLDMIITIVGEFYGQRDLLGGRLIWGDVDLDCG